MKLLTLIVFSMISSSFILAQKLEIEASDMELIFCDDNVIYKFSSADSTNYGLFIGKKIQNIEFPNESTEMTISFDPMVVPDAFYVKYGDQEFFSGFIGDAWNPEYNNVALSLEERKKMIYILPKSMVNYILARNDDDLSSIENLSRNFAGELFYYRDKEGLLDRINTAIAMEGGKLKVEKLLNQNDTEVAKIVEQIKNIGIDVTVSENRPNFLSKLREAYYSYNDLMNKKTSLTISKEQRDTPITILVFSPLSRTRFNMQLNCR